MAERDWIDELAEAPDVITGIPPPAAEGAEADRPDRPTQMHSPPGGTDPYEKLPAELKALPCWVVWKYVPRDGHPSKVPFDPKTGKPAKSNDPKTWSDYDTAVFAASEYEGLGCNIVPPNVGVDLDKVRNPKTGQTEEWALQIIRELDSYTELSPSGGGYHIWVCGELPPKGRRKGRVEMYGDGRYFTMTGRHVPGTPLTIEARDLASLHARMVAGELEPGTETRIAQPPPPGSDTPEESKPKPKAKAEGKLARLMAGEWRGDYTSQSEADSALCVLLARKLACDAGKIDAEFRRSGLMREKWARQDYRESTIERAIKLVKGEPGSQGTALVIEEPDLHEDVFPAFPSLTLDGDSVGELTHILSDGTQIPTQFIRSNVKTILGAAMNRRVGYPQQADLHMRQYNLNISLRERTGKGESWKRTGRDSTGLLNSLLVEAGVDIVPGGLFGSGQYLAKALADRAAGAAYNPLVRFDEMKEFFQRGEIRASTLETALLQLYEETGLAQGSFTNGKHEVKDTHLSLSGDFTRDGFDAAFAGQGSRGSGFLARCVLSFGDKVPHAGDWLEYDAGLAVATVARIRERLEGLPQVVMGGTPTLLQGRFVPSEDEEARRRRLEFFSWLDAQESKFTSELKAHFKRDLLVRVVFSEDQRITAGQVDRSIAWTQHQLELRRLLWPEDAGLPVERMERKILAVLRKHGGPLPDRVLAQLCNVNREGSGGREVYGRALRALVYGSHEVVKVGETRKGAPVWALAEW
jgi:putative DNA primase/helicase